MKITLYSLSGCTTCESLKSQLRKLSLTFTDIECNGDVPICDKVETITNCEIYPIIDISRNDHENILLCIAKDIDQLKNNHKYNNYTIIYVHSIVIMLDIVKK